MKKFEQDYKYLYKQKVEECERLKQERVYEKFLATAEKVLSSEEIENLKNSFFESKDEIKRNNADFINTVKMSIDMFGKIVNTISVFQRALELACEDRCMRCYSKITGNCRYNPETYDCKSQKMFIQQAKKEMEE